MKLPQVQKSKGKKTKGEKVIKLTHLLQVDLLPVDTFEKLMLLHLYCSVEDAEQMELLYFLKTQGGSVVHVTYL